MSRAKSLIPFDFEPYFGKIEKMFNILEKRDKSFARTGWQKTKDNKNVSLSRRPLPLGCLIMFEEYSRNMIYNASYRPTIIGRLSVGWKASSDSYVSPN